jgi:MFS transporter, ACS family, hexuronate transporter
MPVFTSRWTLCGLLFLATTLNYLDRQTLAILAPIMRTEMGLSNEDLGWLFAVFYYSYTLAQFVAGGLLDRMQLRSAYALGVLAWSCVAALTATANGFASLIIFRLLLGVTESVNWPAAMRIVARSLAPAERSLGNGIFTSGTSVGALIAPSLILGIAAWSNWRWSFVFVGCLGALWFACWIAIARNSAYDHVWRPEPRDASHSSRLQAYKTVVKAPQFWRVFLIAILVNPCLYFLLNWLPTYFSQQWSISPKELTWVLTLIFLGLDLGYLFCGAGVLGLTRIGWQLGSSRQTIFLVATVLLSFASLVPYLTSLNTVIAVLVIANFGAGCWIAMYLTMAQEVSVTHVSTAAGLLGGSGSLAGAFAMWAVGRVTQQTSSFAAPLACIAIAAVIAAAAGTLVVRNRPS